MKKYVLSRSMIIKRRLRGNSSYEDLKVQDRDWVKVAKELAADSERGIIIPSRLYNNRRKSITK